jgi:hypothetical protein
VPGDTAGDRIADKNMRHRCLCRHTAGDQGARWVKAAYTIGAGPAGILRAACGLMTHGTGRGRYQSFRRILAIAWRSAAAAGHVIGRNHLFNAGQMFGGEPRLLRSFAERDADESKCFILLQHGPRIAVSMSSSDAQIARDRLLRPCAKQGV